MGYIYICTYIDRSQTDRYVDRQMVGRQHLVGRGHWSTAAVGFASATALSAAIAPTLLHEFPHPTCETYIATALSSMYITCLAWPCHATFIALWQGATTTLRALA